MLDKAAGYGYKKIGFILDRGYFSRGNIKEMDKHGYSFVIMVKGMYDLVSSLVLENKNTFENTWSKHIDEYDVYGTTVKRKLYETDSKEMNMAKEKEIVLFENEDKEITLNVKVNQDTVWLNRNQMADLFGRDVKTIGKHINNALKEELDNSTVANFATVQKGEEGDDIPSD
jgi:hypothetical protein